MTKFVIEPYNKYFAADKAAKRYIFTLHEQAYAIKEFEFKNGTLVREILVEEDIPKLCQLYDTYEDAYVYVQKIKQLNW